MTAPRSEPLHHAPALTVMRGVAALIILNLHAWRWTAPPEIGEPPALHYLVSTRYIAMPLFFVLSGWVIHYNFSRYLPATGEFALRREAMNYLKFFAKRLVRLYPLYIVLFGFICYVDDRLFTPPAHWHVFWRYVTLTHSWTFLMIHDLPSFHSTFSLSWSISTELALYLSYPVLGFIALRLRDGKRVAMAMAGTLAIAVTMAEVAVHYRFQFARLARAQRLRAHAGRVANRLRQPVARRARQRAPHIQMAGLADQPVILRGVEQAAIAGKGRAKEVRQWQCCRAGLCLVAGAHPLQ